MNDSISAGYINTYEMKSVSMLRSLGPYTGIDRFDVDQSERYGAMRMSTWIHCHASAEDQAHRIFD